MSGASLRVKRQLFEWTKEALSRTSLRKYVLHHYDYMHHPAHLCHLMHQLDEVADVPGAIVEIGCAFGASTVFLNKHLDYLELNPDYVCIDTFSGFTTEDVAEERSRGNRSRLENFRTNRKVWFERTMELNGIERVRVVQGDISDVALPVDAVRYCLVDVDLYRPVLAALEKVWPVLSPGGVIVVDDVSGKSFYRNALAAYNDFAERNGLPIDLRDGHGVFRKPVAASDRAASNGSSIA